MAGMPSPELSSTSHNYLDGRLPSQRPERRRHRIMANLFTDTPQHKTEPIEDQVLAIEYKLPLQLASKTLKAVPDVVSPPAQERPLPQHDFYDKAPLPPPIPIRPYINERELVLSHR